MGCDLKVKDAINHMQRDYNLYNQLISKHLPVEKKTPKTQ